MEEVEIARLAREQGLDEACTIHNYTVVPVRGKYLLLSAAYEAGTSLIDFTDPLNAREIAFYDAQGLDGKPSANTWSSYWYNNFIYESEITKGLNVFRLSDDVTAGAIRLDRLNPQTQETSLP